MLFISDLLKFQTMFGKLWLAGTIGVKKRPFNKEIISSSSVKEFVDAFFNCETPLAPRLCGTLLCGICNIYNQKGNLLYADVSTFLKKLYKSQVDSIEEDSSAFSILNKKAGRNLKGSSKRKMKAHRDSTTIEEMLNHLEEDTFMYIPEEQGKGQDAHSLNVFLEPNSMNIDSYLFEGLNDAIADQHINSSAVDPIMLFEQNFHVIGEFYLPSQDDRQRTKTLQAELEDVVNDNIEKESDVQESGAGDEDQLSVDNRETTDLEDIHDNLVCISTPEPLMEHDVATCEGGAYSSGQVHKRIRKERRQQCINSSLLDKRTVLTDSDLHKWQNGLFSQTKTPQIFKGFHSLHCTNETPGIVLKCSARLNRIIEKVDDRKCTMHSTFAFNQFCTTDTTTTFDMYTAQPKKHYSAASSKDDRQESAVDALVENLQGRSFDDIERLRGIFDVNDDERYENTALRYQMRQNHLFRHSTNTIEEQSSRFSLYSSGHKDNSFNRTSSDMLSIRGSLFEGDRKSITSLCHQNPKMLQAAYDETPLHPSLLLSAALSENQTLSSPGFQYKSYNNAESAYTIETWKFRTFIESQFKRHQNPSQLSFFDIVPVRKVDSFIAARSFYNLLILISSGDFDTYCSTYNQEILIMNTLGMMSPNDGEREVSSEKNDLILPEAVKA